MTHTGTDRCQRNCFVELANKIAAERNGRGSMRRLLSRYSGSSLADEQWRFASTAGE